VLLCLTHTHNLFELELCFSQFASVRLRSIAISVSVCVSVCLSACPSVCPLAYLKNRTSIFQQIFCIYVAVDWFSFDDNAIRCVHPLLCMTLCLYIMMHMQWLDGSCHVIDERPVTPCLSDIDTPAAGNKRFDCGRVMGGRRSLLSPSALCPVKMLPRISAFMTKIAEKGDVQQD